MLPYSHEKRKYPRLDISDLNPCQIRVFGVAAKPLVGRIVNISLGGVAFTSHYRNIAKAVKKQNTRVRIQLPNGRSIDASTSLVRVKPQIGSDQCVCVMRLTELKGKNSLRLARFIAN